MIGRRGRCTAPVRYGMRIAFLTGIWPPDVGGPATHGPDFARFLVGRGHTVHVVTMGDGEPAERPCEVEVVSRRLPFPVRYGQVALRGARAASGRRRPLRIGDVRGRGGCAPVSRGGRFVAKLVSDPAYERARRYGLFRGSLEEFQDASTPAVRALKALRTRALRRAHGRSSSRAHTSPRSRAGWGLRRDRMHVLTNPAPPPREVEPEQLEPGTFVFVGRLTRQKALGDRDRRDRPRARGAPRPRRRRPRARAPRAARRPTPARRDRIAFRGALSRDDALAHVAGADAALLSSDWENLPHSAVEALSVGVPGGLDGRRRRPRGRAGRRERPARGAGARGRARGCDRPDRRRTRAAGTARRRREALGRRDLERGDLRPARGAAGGGGEMSAKPRVLFVGRMRYQPAAPGVAREEVGRRRAASSTTASSARRRRTVRRAMPASG